MFDTGKLSKKIKAVEKSGLIENKDRILIAFSGGPDSVFLFEVLKFLKTKYSIETDLIYINHNLRSDVEKDLCFVQEFSKINGVSLYIRSADVSEYAKRNRKSIELSARELRYNIIEELAEREKYNKIATGHNLDDNIETVVFRLLRGTSLRGMKGIPERRGKIIRPLLQFEKREILNYLHENGKSYIMDYTNNENDFTRNYIRNEIFPKFMTVNPNFRRKVNELILEVKERDSKKNRLSAVTSYKKMSKEGLAEYLEEHDVQISRRKIDQIYKFFYENDGSIKTEGSKEFNLGNNKILRKKYDKIEITEISNEEITDERQALKEGRKIIWNDYELYLFESKAELEELLPDILKENNYTFLGIDEGFSGMELVVRRRREGDTIFLHNLGHKKVKKVLIDEKIPKWERDRIPVLTVKYFKEEGEQEEILSVGNVKFSKYVNKLNIKNINTGEVEERIIIIGRKNER